MTVIFSKTCELGLQTVLFLSIKKQQKIIKAAEIAEEIGAPKEYVAKVLQMMTNSGIVGSKKGKSGGFYLAKAPSRIKLIDIVEAIDGLEVFNQCVLGFAGCGTGEPCPVHHKWGTLRENAYKMLSSETLEELREKTVNKITSL